MRKPNDLRDREYLGDGVYAAHDDYHIWLWLGDGGPENRAIALEPNVLNRLEKYRLRIFGSGLRDES